MPPGQSSKQLAVALLLVGSPIAARAAPGFTEGVATPGNHRFDLAAKRAELLAHARPLDWSVLLGTATAVVYVGEAHYNASIREELAARMPEFKKAGITGLGVEVPYTVQPALDAFLKDPGNGAVAAALLAALKAQRIIAFPGMFRLIEAAARAKLDVLAIDQSFAGVTRENFKLGAQNEGMAARIGAKLAAEPGSRLLVLLGYGHLVDKAQSQWLARHGISSKRYIFLTTGLETPFVSRPDFACISDSAHYEFYTALKDGPLWGKSLFLPQKEFDGFIILPRTLTEKPLPRDRWPPNPAWLCERAPKG